MLPQSSPRHQPCHYPAYNFAPPPASAASPRSFTHPAEPWLHLPTNGGQPPNPVPTMVVPIEAASAAMANYYAPLLNRRSRRLSYSLQPRAFRHLTSHKRGEAKKSRSRHGRDRR
ncbi:hypothetical protein VFPFJ_08774 [Purpureocillium lilacinum]|uniref:Uncharacterized protein n=1 Tax=Purpureocillium lilacinum TaxID=33203 RepID=A0A179H0G2_PURLI|nr:hypothetical protein VFPFJ_08774 [Purpureocillium lilacinum]OAQ74858.1 hypothetical protein VFPBJ_10153 [Purpureocillium lilacinum]OAQ82971.1 hypothetical protein VFPFJ_08774 [Purpureocillium lilacinum]